MAKKFPELTKDTNPWIDEAPQNPMPNQSIVQQKIKHKDKNLKSSQRKMIILKGKKNTKSWGLKNNGMCWNKVTTNPECAKLK